MSLTFAREADVVNLVIGLLDFPNKDRIVLVASWEILVLLLCSFVPFPECNDGQVDVLAN